MSSAFSIDFEDMKFILFDQLDIVSDLSGFEAYEDFDRELYETAIEEAIRVATELIHPHNAHGDQVGCTLDSEGNIKTPPGYNAAWDVVAEGGWVNCAAPVDAGGAGLPHILYMATTEIFISASMAFAMYPGLTSAAARLIYHYGPDAWRLPLAEKLYTGVWGGTMCLTEAGAGSDVGENRARATELEGEPGVYALEGEKIFISGADQDLTDNIIHLVLARTPGSPPGTKGLGLFMVPKFLFDLDTHVMGERNDAVVVGIEEKMGIHGSATCTLALGANRTCRGWLIGGERDGIKLMFTMMNEARIGVGAQGVGVAAAAYNYALNYAKQRTQGSSVENFKDASAPRVAITAHPDVRRMLMTMKVHTETMRSMLYRLGHRTDLIEHGGGAFDHFRGQIDLLVPILKAHCTDMGFEVAVTGVQVLGGYGYIGEYHAEQYARDAKIASIYEGTNGIQALDLLGRKLRIQGGALLMQWIQDGMACCAAGRGVGFAAQATAIEKALQQAGASAMHLGGLGGSGKLEVALVQAYPFLQQMGTIQLALEAMNQAQVAQRCIAERGATPHLKGKLLNLDFYVSNILPKATAYGKIVTSGDQSCLDEILFH